MAPSICCKQVAHANCCVEDLGTGDWISEVRGHLPYDFVGLYHKKHLSILPILQVLDPLWNTAMEQMMAVSALRLTSPAIPRETIAGAHSRSVVLCNDKSMSKCCIQSRLIGISKHPMQMSTIWYDWVTRCWFLIYGMTCWCKQLCVKASNGCSMEWLRWILSNYSRTSNWLWVFPWTRHASCIL